MHDFGRENNVMDRPYHRRAGEIAPPAPTQPDAQQMFAEIDAAMAQCRVTRSLRTRGRPKANRVAIARSLVAMPVLGIPTIGALIERLVGDPAFRLGCGWRTPSEVPTQATFSRARAELAEILPETIHRLLPSLGRHALPLRDEPEPVPEPRGKDDADPLLLMLNRLLLSMVREEERDLTLPQLAMFLTCYLVDRQHTVRTLADELDLLPTDVLRVLVLLCQRRLLGRKIDPRNRRRVIIFRTAIGQQFLSLLLQARTEGEE